MSLTVQQLLSDAKRLTGRLRDHDSATDGIISAAQDVLKEVEAMRQYQEDIESLNTIAHNRPRAQLVLGKLEFKLIHALCFIGNVLGNDFFITYQFFEKIKQHDYLRSSFLKSSNNFLRTFEKPPFFEIYILC